MVLGLEGLIGVSFGPTRGAIYKTYDGGGEWFTALTPVLGATRPQLVTPAGILDRSHWWLADANRLWRTSDGGKSWLVVNLKIRGGLKLAELHPVGPHELWGLAARHPGQDGDALLFYSGDAGASWQPVALPSGL